MSARQKRRRAWAQVKAASAGRAWQTGDAHAEAVRLNRRREYLVGWHPPLAWRPLPYSLPNVTQLDVARSESERRSERANRVHFEKSHQTVLARGLPTPVVSTFKRSI